MAAVAWWLLMTLNVIGGIIVLGLIAGWLMSFNWAEIGEQLLTLAVISFLAACCGLFLASVATWVWGMF